jgi:hypothetical protein
MPTTNIIHLVDSLVKVNLFVDTRSDLWYTESVARGY